MSPMKRRAFLIIFALRGEKKEGDRKQRAKWDAPVFGFLFPPGWSALWVESISQEHWDATRMWEEDGENAPNAFVIIKSSAGRAEQRSAASRGSVKRESTEGSCPWLTSLCRRCGLPCALLVFRIIKTRIYIRRCFHAPRREHDRTASALLFTAASLRAKSEKSCLSVVTEMKEACERSCIVNLLRPFDASEAAAHDVWWCFSEALFHLSHVCGRERQKQQSEHLASCFYPGGGVLVTFVVSQVVDLPIEVTK